MKNFLKYLNTHGTHLLLWFIWLNVLIRCITELFKHPAPYIYPIVIIGIVCVILFIISEIMLYRIYKKEKTAEDKSMYNITTRCVIDAFTRLQNEITDENLNTEQELLKHGEFRDGYFKCQTDILGLINKRIKELKTSIKK